MSNLNKHAIAEFKAAGWLDDTGAYIDEMQGAICEHVLDLLRVFADEGHSGSTAPYTVNMFKKLAMFEPLVPLSGEDWEWTEVSDGVFQNKRCSRVFKQADRFNGQPYDLDGRVFREPNGSCYTSKDSMVPITFPYTPKTEYVDVKGDSNE
jgi:hypothetical protein